MDKLTMGELPNDSFHSYMPSDQDIQNSKDAVNSLIQIASNRNANTAATGCQKPLINVGKKKAAYEKCLADNKKAASAPAPVYIAPTRSASYDEPKPFFKTGGGIAVIVVGSIGLVVGTILAIKHFKK